MFIGDQPHSFSGEAHFQQLDFFSILKFWNNAVKTANQFNFMDLYMRLVLLYFLFVVIQIYITCLRITKIGSGLIVYTLIVFDVVSGWFVSHYLFSQPKSSIKISKIGNGLIVYTLIVFDVVSGWFVSHYLFSQPKSIKISKIGSGLIVYTLIVPM